MTCMMLISSIQAVFPHILNVDYRNCVSASPHLHLASFDPYTLRGRRVVAEDCICDKTITIKSS